MYIRKLDIRDFKMLKMFHEEHFQSYKISEKSFHAYLTQPQYNTYGMFHVKHLVGYVIFLTAGKEADIVYIATHPDHRNKGIGSELINDYTRNSRVSQIFIEVDETNLNAQKFYTKLGFEIINRRKD